MPRVLPLYHERPKTPLEEAQPLKIDRDCTLCELSRARRVNSVCMRPEGTPGGLLVISDYPGRVEDNTGRPMSGETGAYLRKVLRRWWNGPIALDNAIKCTPGDNADVTASMVSACRRYAAKTLEVVQPVKILVMGGVAIRSVLGRSLAPYEVRKGYSWIVVGGKPVPAYVFPNPVNALRNRFLRAWFEEDLEWALTTDPPFGPIWEGEARVVESTADAETAAVDLRAAGWGAYDVEASGFMWRAHQIVCASLSPAGKDYAWVWADKGLFYEGPRRVLIDLLRDTEFQKTGSNIKYDVLSTRADLGCRVRGVKGDSRLLRKLLEPEASGYLEDMAELVGMGGHKEEANQALVAACSWVGKIARQNVGNQLSLVPLRIEGVRDEVIQTILPGVPPKTFAFGLMPRDVCIRYNALDSISSNRLETLLSQRSANDDARIARTYKKTVMPASHAVRQIEEWGILVDRQRVLAFRSYLEAEENALATRLQNVAARSGFVGQFNPASTRQVADLLFKRLGLLSKKTTKNNNPSTDEEALEAIRGSHEAVDLLLDYRKYSKFKGTYAVGMLRHIRGDGRIHPNILLEGTRTGRPSCTEPNLQTIPRDSDSEMGKMARDLFVAPPGYLLASVDYSQIELRVAAMLSGDPIMIELFKSGKDFHWATAYEIAKTAWGLSRNQLQKSHRTKAKTVNFGLLYGQEDSTLAAALGCSVVEASRVRQSVLGKFKRLDQWIMERAAEARRTGYCWTWWAGQYARRRPLWRIADKDRYEARKAERGSWNTPIQGTASEYLIMSMIEIINWILYDGVPAKVVLPVHDSLLLEIREDCVDEVVRECQSIMTSWDSQGVPLVVDIDVGPRYGSLEKYQLAA